MNTEISLEKLLRWRLARAEAEAPPAPRAAHLLELTRPWWETWPERFHALVERLGKMQVVYGHAMTTPASGRTGHLVPVLIVRSGQEVEASARMLYFSVRDGRLRLRFQLDDTGGQPEPTFEATLVSDPAARPLLSATASLSVGNEYRLDADLAESFAKDWVPLKVTDRMPFRLILRSGTQST